MKNIVFLNSARIDFDRRINFSSLQDIGQFTYFSSSNEGEILERVQNQNILITKEIPIGRELIEKFPDTVKLICEAGTGYNNIDIQAAKERNIAVCNIPDYSTDAVAQLAVTFILSLCSSLCTQQVMLKQGEYSNFTGHLQVNHFEIQGKTLGVIGAGSIGGRVIKTARALGMNILVYSRTPKEYADEVIRYTNLDSLLAQSDFVSIHCPLTQDTRHLIDMDKIKLMKNTAYVINTSRGPIIREADLIEALQKGLIAGAALDVQDPEPPVLDNPLFKMRNVILTPHIGWKCIETRQRLIDRLAECISGFLSGRPANIVNK